MISTPNRTGTITYLASHQPPAPVSRIILLAVIALGSGLAMTFGLARSSYHSYTGYLQAKSRTVTAGRDARIARILIEQGEVAVPGRPLVLLKDIELEAQRAGKHREVAALRAELAQVHAKAAIEISRLQQQLEAEIFNVKLRTVQYVTSQFANRQAGFESQGNRSLAADIDPHHPGIMHALEVSDAKVELCQDRLATLENNLAQLPNQILEALGVHVVQARLDKAAEELTRLDQQERALNLTAEVHGTVGVFVKQTGDYVKPNEPIVELLDEDQPYLIVQVPSSRLADFTPGTVLGLRFPGGFVGEGKVEVIPPQVAPLPRTGSRLAEDDAVITVHIAPSGRVWPKLPFGSVIEVRR